MPDQENRGIDTLLPEYSLSVRNSILEILKADLTRLEVPDFKYPEEYRTYLITLEHAINGELVLPGYPKQLSIRVAKELCPKLKLFHILISPAEESDPLSGGKHLTESIQKLREFVCQLWPKKKRRGRMIEVDSGWLTKDEEEISWDKVRLTEEKTALSYRILTKGRR